MAMAVQAMSGLTFGCDPELFIMNRKTGEFVCPDGIIPGTKSEPYQVPYGAVQQDGMAAEFNIEPVTTFAEFNRNIDKVLGSLRKFLPPDHQLVALPAVIFTPEVWEKASDVAKELGCSPDFNAWTGNVNPPPNPEKASSPMLRTASGHLHFGWCEDANMSDPEHVANCRDLVKQLDWYLGPWSLSMDPDPTRRELYGKAGACRFKSYGVEYRVLSNFWVMDVRRRLQVWNRMQAAIWDMRKTFLPEVSEESFGPVANDMLVQSIDQSKIDPALVSMFPKQVGNKMSFSNYQIEPVALAA